MKRKILILTFCIMIGHVPIQAQIIDGNCFIKANYVELGIGPCGVFGTTVDAPAGFHPRGGSDFPLRLGFVADQGRDGWNVGSPSYCGDYFVPGAPEEGWGITMNGVSYNNNLLCDVSEIPGGIVQYSNNGTTIFGKWQGSINGLQITSKTSVPLDKLYFLTEITMRNLSQDTIRDLYYMRNIDPDNEVALSGDYNTLNLIIDQNPNTNSKAVVSAEGLAYGCFIALGSRDCRARVSWGGFSNRSAKDAWNCLSPHQCSGSLTDDIAITIAFKLGDLRPGEQASFKFVNVLDVADVDESVDLTGPAFSIGGGPMINSNDTSQICSSGPTDFEIINTGGYDTWTWAPSVGLNTTSGPHVICDGNIDTVTYTATGQNACGNIIQINFTAIKGNIVNVPKAGPISGPSTFCEPNAFATYSISPLPGAMRYEWHVPAGTSILSGDGTNSIILSLGATVIDSIWVRGINACGPGDTSLIRIKLLMNLGPTLIKYTFIGDSITCEANSSKIKPVYSLSYGNAASFQWYKNNMPIPGATDSILTVDSSGIYRVEVTTNFGCTYKLKDTTLLFFPNPIALFKLPDGCTNSNVMFTDSSTISNGSISNWVWEKNGSIFSTIQNPVIDLLPGMYSIQLKVKSDHGCWSEPASASFTRFGQPTADFLISGKCSDSLTIFNAFELSPGYGNDHISNWNWDLGNQQAASGQTHSLIYGAAGYYDVKLIFYGNNCKEVTNTVTHRIHLGDAAPAKRYHNIIAFEGEQFFLKGQEEGISYEWSPPTGLTNPRDKISAGVLTRSQLYTVHVLNNYGCGRTDTVQVIILNECKSYSPNAFTPNDDGVNDKFRVYFACLKTLNRFSIFNRWGQNIFTTRNSEDSWDGTFKGVKQPGGTYIWVAEGEYRSGKKFSERGVVTLIR